MRTARPAASRVSRCRSGGRSVILEVYGPTPGRTTRQTFISAATRPLLIAASSAAWSFSVWSAYAAPNSASAWSMALSSPRYAAIVAGSPVRAWPRASAPAAQLTPRREVVDRHHLDDRARLRILELAQVEVATHRADRPAEHDVAGRLQPPLACDDTFAVRCVPARPEEPLEDGCLRLLDLEEQRIVLVAALEQSRESHQADAADADDLHARRRRTGTDRAGRDGPPGAWPDRPPGRLASIGEVIRGSW